jgi:hypothetical protein
MKFYPFGSFKKIGQGEQQFELKAVISALVGYF